MERCLFDETFFLGECEAAYYWAGFIAADGNISDSGRVSLAVAEKDIDHLLKFKKVLSAEHKITKWTNKNGTVMHRIAIRSKMLTADLLDKFNIGPRKSLSYNPPPFSTKYERHFWRGYFDGDGCVTSAGHYLALQIVGSFDTIIEFIRFVQKNGIVNRHVPSKKGKVYTTTYMGSPAIQLHKLLYSDCSIKLERKANGALQFS